MATIQTLFNRMEMLFPELQLESGQSDVTKGLVAVNAAQDALESILALHPEVAGSSTSDITTAADTETTAFPAGLLRIDKLQYIDPTTSRPAWDITPVHDVGGHAFRQFLPLLSASTQSTGKPRFYWVNGTNFYWDPLPDATNTVRVYGFFAATDYTLASDTFAYPDIALTPVAALAVKFIRTGLDDAQPDLTTLANDIFDPMIETMSNFTRERGTGFSYRYSHDT